MISLYITMYLAIVFVSVVCFEILLKREDCTIANAVLLGLIWPLSVPIFTFIILGKIVRDFIKC